MAADLAIRRLEAADLKAYKKLRDEMLECYPEGFTSDADSERHRRAEDYLPRLGLEATHGGHLTLGAWSGTELIGCISLERDLRPKVRHIGHVIGMMVRTPAQRLGTGRALLEALVRGAGPGVELLTLTVTEGNSAAIGLYQSAGFEPFGRLQKALRIGDRYYAKLHMVKYL